MHTFSEHDVRLSLRDEQIKDAQGQCGAVVVTAIRIGESRGLAARKKKGLEKVVLLFRDFTCLIGIGDATGKIRRIC